MGLFGGDSSSKTSSKTITRTDTDSSITDVNQGAGGITLSKKDRGRQVLNISGVQSEDLGGFVQALSGSTIQAFSAGADTGQVAADIAKATTGTQTEVGRIVGQVAFPIIALAGLIFFFRGR